jgi:tetratricopeptide (TPR) repeat protein
MVSDSLTSTSRAPVDWRASSWLAPDSALKPGERERQEAALRVLDDYSTKGTPFALFLRTFRVRQLYCHASEGGDGGEGILLDVHFTRELHRIGAHVLRVRDTDQAMENAIPTETPTLALDNSTWLDAVKRLIDSAELVISECQFLTPGVVDELRACAATKLDQTILVTPSAPFEFAGNDELAQLFPRMIQQFDLDLACPVRTYVVRDLVERIGDIARMDMADRLALRRDGRLRELIPVSYRGVVEGALQLAQRYAAEKNPGATYFAGSRAIISARQARGQAGSLETQLTVSKLCQDAGDSRLALVLVDEVERGIGEAGSTLSDEPRDRLESAVKQRRSESLSTLFDSVLDSEKPEELWRLANSQAGYAVQRGDSGALAQCLSWMAVAAVLREQYELAIELTEDAIGLAHESGDSFREAFAWVYRGNALRALNRLDEAAKALATAIQTFPPGTYGRIHAVTMISLAEVSEQLGMNEYARDLYQSASDMAIPMGQSDIEAAARRGMDRLDS